MQQSTRNIILGTNKILPENIKNLEEEQTSIIDIIIHELDKKIKKMEEFIDFLKSIKYWGKEASSEIKKKIFAGLIRINFALKIRKFNKASKNEVN